MIEVTVFAGFQAESIEQAEELLSNWKLHKGCNVTVTVQRMSVGLVDDEGSMRLSQAAIPAPMGATVIPSEELTDMAMEKEENPEGE